MVIYPHMSYIVTPRTKELITYNLLVSVVPGSRKLVKHSFLVVGVFPLVSARASHPGLSIELLYTKLTPDLPWWTGMSPKRTHVLF